MRDFSRVRFKGTFRDYQAKILQNANRHLQDKKIHIVAAPGSGKTILGLELIRGLGAPALVLSPSVTIRQQWGERFESGFLPEGEDPGEYLSYDLRSPSLITSITYQALYAAWNRKTLDVSDEDENEQADFTDFQILQAVKQAGIKTVCLDEAHHLRSEWQRALEAFIKSLSGAVTIISLTATPPYDSTPAEWKSYHSLCGDIDDEIFVPQLVAQKTLCPHQDYIIFSYPTPEEQQQLNNLRQKRGKLLSELPRDPLFAQAVEESGATSRRLPEDILYEHYDGFIKLFTVACSTNPPLAAELPGSVWAAMSSKPNSVTAEDLEGACQLIVSNTGLFGKAGEALEAKLRSVGAVQRGRVCLDSDNQTEKTLISSMGKLASIADIARAEERNLGQKLRLLILTDFIGQAHMAQIGGTEPIGAMGAVPVFEYLRRSSAADLAVLTGAGVILPAASLDRASQLAKSLNIRFTAQPTNAPEYCSVNVSGSNKNKVALVTAAFEQGLFRVLIGTKSLLGEGWDSPCINSLILASFVGSFMLSNQMRGRAIRTDKNRPDKVSNIFHLVTLDPNSLNERELSGADYDTVKRRFDTFQAPAYSSDVIESGIDRLDVIKPPFNADGIARINQNMYALAADREGMKRRWQTSLSTASSQTPQVADTAGVETVPLVFAEKLKSGAFKTLAVTIAVLAAINLMLFLPLAVRLVLSGITALIGIPLFISRNNRAKKQGSVAGSLKIIADAICVTLQANGTLSKNCRCVVKQVGTGAAAALENATSREQKVFQQSVKELLSPIDNPRYLICRGTNGVISFACPSAVGNKKENAEYLAAQLNKTAADFRVVYTRSEKGRKELLLCRCSSVTNTQGGVSTKRIML